MGALERGQAGASWANAHVLVKQVAGGVSGRRTVQWVCTSVAEGVDVVAVVEFWPMGYKTEKMIQNIV